MNGFRMHSILVVLAMISLVAAAATGHAANMNAFSFQDTQHSAAVMTHHADHAARNTVGRSGANDTTAVAQHQHTDAAECGGDMCVAVFVLPPAPVFGSQPAVLVNAHLGFLDFALSSVDAAALQRPPQA